MSVKAVGGTAIEWIKNISSSDYERKMLMAFSVMSQIDDYYCEHLADKGCVTTNESIKICELAGQARAWLIDTNKKGE